MRDRSPSTLSLTLMLCWSNSFKLALLRIWSTSLPQCSPIHVQADFEKDPNFEEELKSELVAELEEKVRGICLKTKLVDVFTSSPLLCKSLSTLSTGLIMFAFSSASLDSHVSRLSLGWGARKDYLLFEKPAGGDCGEIQDRLCLSRMHETHASALFRWKAAGVHLLGWGHGLYGGSHCRGGSRRWKARRSVWWLDWWARPARRPSTESGIETRTFFGEMQTRRTISRSAL